MKQPAICGLIFSVESLILEGGDDRPSRNVDNYQSTLCNIPEEGRPHFHHGIMKSRIVREFFRAMNKVIRVFEITN
jgi:hypothetical protein